MYNIRRKEETALETPAAPGGEHPVTPLPESGLQGRQHLTGVGGAPNFPFFFLLLSPTRRERGMSEAGGGEGADVPCRWTENDAEKHPIKGKQMREKGLCRSPCAA